MKNKKISIICIGSLFFQTSFHGEKLTTYSDEIAIPEYTVNNIQQFIFNYIKTTHELSQKIKKIITEYNEYIQIKKIYNQTNIKKIHPETLLYILEIILNTKKYQYNYRNIR